jgi:hypothetical protein
MTGRGNNHIEKVKTALGPQQARLALVCDAPALNMPGEIRRQDSRQPPLYVLAGQDAPRLGKLSPT